MNTSSIWILSKPQTCFSNHPASRIILKIPRQNTIAKKAVPEYELYSTFQVSMKVIDTTTILPQKRKALINCIHFKFHQLKVRRNVFFQIEPTKNTTKPLKLNWFRLTDPHLVKLRTQESFAMDLHHAVKRVFATASWCTAFARLLGVCL